MRPTRLVLLVLLLVPFLVASVPGDAAGSATSVGPWAATSHAVIHPGVRTYTNGAQCTANFVFEQKRYINGKWVREVFLGQAAHCASKKGNTKTNGCTTSSHPLGTKVEIVGSDGVSYWGTLAYSSWLQMQADRETNGSACRYNDFALVKLASRDHGRVNPSVPVWGGPHGLGGGTSFGDNVYTYGRSWLRLGLHSDHEGVSLGTTSSGWSHRVYTVTPGIPGDSGSAFLDASGRAIGVLSTVALTPYPASNGVSDLRRALGYMKAHRNDFDNLSLVNGTERFDGGLLP